MWNRKARQAFFSRKSLHNEATTPYSNPAFANVAHFIKPIGLRKHIHASWAAPCLARKPTIFDVWCGDPGFSPEIETARRREVISTVWSGGQPNPRSPDADPTLARRLTVILGQGMPPA
jgi:hypothetical protein